jgi:hypothetical protein
MNNPERSDVPVRRFGPDRAGRVRIKAAQNSNVREMEV